MALAVVNSKKSLSKTGENSAVLANSNFSWTLNRELKPCLKLCKTLLQLLMQSALNRVFRMSREMNSAKNTISRSGTKETKPSGPKVPVCSVNSESVFRFQRITTGKT